jgi:hypothetical protein
MKLIDKSLIASFRGSICEWCLYVAASEGHHIFSKGAGRVDIRGNLVSLCRLCHTKAHAGHSPTREQLLTVAARREKTTAEAITAEVQRIRRLTKEGKEPR